MDRIPVALPVVEPSRTDPLVAGGAEAIGGPAGRRARPGSSWWTPIRVLIALATAGYALGYLLDVPCIAGDWASPDRYSHLCYSDIPPLFSLRGFADGFLPYLQTPPDGQPLEYPVLTGLFMLLAAWITRAVVAAVDQASAMQVFFTVNVVLLLPFLWAAVVGTARTVRRRPWDAAMVALAPGMILAATINWDLLAVGLTALAIAAWARRREGWAGILLGLAVAAKFYPLVLLGPWFLLCLRAGRLRQFARLLGGAAVTWLAVNLPFMIAAPDGWRYFYSFSQVRGEDFGSLWYALTLLRGEQVVAPDRLNMVATAALVLLCAGIAWLALGARRRPRLAQLLFLVVAAFALTNKVYSPQYVLWLIPLAALARPRWRDFLIWQLGEVLYFLAIWWYLVGFGVEGEKGLTPQWYAAATLLHLVVTAWFAGLVVRDVLRPQHDPVRTDGVPEHADDPGGGCLDGAPDVVVLPGVRSANAARGVSAGAVPASEVQALHDVEARRGEPDVAVQRVADGGYDAAGRQPQQ